MAHGFHFPCLVQSLLGLLQTLLIVDPLTDVVGEDERCSDVAVVATNAVEAQLIMALCSALAKPLGHGELLASQRSLPKRQRNDAVVLVGWQQLRQFIAHVGGDAVKVMKVVLGLTIDRQPSQLGIQHMDIGRAVIDELSEQLSLRHRDVDALFQILLDLLQQLFGLAPLGDIPEQHRHLPPSRRFDAKAGDREDVAGGDQRLFEVGRFARSHTSRNRATHKWASSGINSRTDLPITSQLPACLV